MDKLTGELKKAQANAFSIQSMPEGRSPVFIGKVEQPDGWIYKFYKDQNNDYWFDTLIRKDGKVMTLHEAVRGKKVMRR